MKSNETNERLKRDTQHVPLRQNAEEYIRCFRHDQTDLTLQINETRSEGRETGPIPLGIH